jgi:alpha-mannosidase
MRNSTPIKAVFIGICGISFSIPTIAGRQILWTIGQRDNSSAEFAQGWFSHAPYRNVIYRVGQSKPSSDWPSIQPADYDPEGAAQDHPFTILFPLDATPKGNYALRLDAFFDRAYYPDLRVNINGHMGAYFFHPKPIPLPSPYWKQAHNNLVLAKGEILAEIPASFLRRGENKLVLTACHGTHLEYDDVQFSRFPEKTTNPIVGVRFLPTVLYRATPGHPEVAEIEVRMRQIPGPVKTEVRIGQFVARQTLNPDGQQLGDLRESLDIPSDLERQPAQVTVSMGTVHRTVRIPFVPAKKWLVYAAPTIHDDVGYRETQPRTRAWMNQNIDDVISLRKQFPWYKYNIEAAWNASDYLHHRSPEARQQLLRLAREGKIGINAFYANMETNAPSPEEMARAFYLAARYHREDGVPMDASAQGDVPTYSGALPTFLCSAGIKFFVGGADQIRAPLYRNAAIAGEAPLNLRSPFFWEGPDGSRVLTWMAVIYAQIARLFWGYPRHDGEFAILPKAPSEELNVARKSLPLFLLNYTRPDYPYDAVLLYGLYGDDHPLGNGEASIIADWNSQYAYPKVIVCRLADFADHVLKNYPHQVPVFKGDMGAYWADGYSTVSREIAWDRQAQALLPAAEKFATISTLVNHRIGFPVQEVDDAWDKLLQTDEHTWGDEYTTSRPHSTRVVQEAQWKADMAQDAWLRSRWILRQALEQLRESLHIPYLTVAVFNPLSWARGGPVDADLDAGESLVDPTTGHQVPYAVIRRVDGYMHVRFWASEVPGLGYKIYQIRKPSHSTRTRTSQAENGEPQGNSNVHGATQGSQSQQAAQFGRDLVVEGKYYRLRIEANTGAIKSLFDRRTGNELVDSSCPYGLNEYVYVSGGEGTSLIAWSNLPPKANQLHFSRERATRIESIRAPWGTRVLIQGSATQTPEIRSEIDVFDTTSRIDITNYVKKDLTYRKESGYFAFPFLADQPTISYRLATGWFRPNKDQLPGAAKEWFLVQDSVRIVDANKSIVWATRDAPDVALEDIVRGTWPVQLPIRNGWIFSWVFNNYWYTNWPPGQGGKFTFRYSLTSSTTADNAAASRFGTELRQPLIPLVTHPEGNQIVPPFGATGPVHKGIGTFVALSPNNVVLLTLKPPEAGSGLIARFQEIAGEKTMARFRLQRTSVDQAFLCNLAEETQRPLPVSGGSVEVPLSPYGIATVRLMIRK